MNEFQKITDARFTLELIRKSFNPNDRSPLTINVLSSLGYLDKILNKREAELFTVKEHTEK